MGLENVAKKKKKKSFYVPATLWKGFNVNYDVLWVVEWLEVRGKTKVEA